MAIDNSAFVIRNQKQRYLLVIVLIVCVSFMLLADFFSEPIAGIPREGYIAIVGGLYFLIIIIRYILDFHYINFAISNNILAIKFYSLRSFGAKRKTIEIPIHSLANFELKSFLGIKPKLILHQKIKGKTAKYPSIPLSALNKTEIAQIKKMLETIVKQNS